MTITKITPTLEQRLRLAADTDPTNPNWPPGQIMLSRAWLAERAKEAQELQHAILALRMAHFSGAPPGSLIAALDRADVLWETGLLVARDDRARPWGA